MSTLTLARAARNALEPHDADRLIKLLGVCGSSHPGERAAAALKADTLVRSLGLTWRDVIIAAPTLQPDAPIGLARHGRVLSRTPIAACGTRARVCRSDDAMARRAERETARLARRHL